MAMLRLAIVPVIAIAATITAWKLGYFRLDHRQQLVGAAARFHDLPWSEVWYVVIYALAIAVVLPATIASLVGGAVFGLWEGALLAWGGALAGTLLTHALARYIARAPMRRLFGEHRLLRMLREHDDVMALLRLRILPVAPFAVLDYVAGVAGASLLRLLIATAIGILPSVVAYAYVGHALMRGLAEGQASHRALWTAGIITVSMMLLSGLPYLLKRWRA